MEKSNKLLKVLLVGLILQQTSTTSIYAITNTSVQNTKTTSNKQVEDDGNLIYSNEVFNLLLKSESLLKEYREKKDITILKKSIDTFCSTTTLLFFDEETDSSKLYNDQNFRLLFYDIRDEVYSISNQNTQASVITYYGEKVFIGWRKNKSVTIFKDLFLKIGLVDYNKDKNSASQDRLDYLKELTIYFGQNIDLDSDSDLIPNKDNYPPKDDFIKPPSNSNNGGSGNGSNNDNNDDITNKPSDTPNSDNSTSDSDSDTYINESFFTEYINRNNSCYAQTTIYRDGVPISATETLLDKSDFVKCGIYNYVHSNNITTNDVLIDNNYINTNQNEDSEYTIHFTINKTSKNPRYYNTGIKADSSNLSVTYNQLKDALYQLSIKKEGFSITSNNKFLCIVDGQPIVIKKSVETYSKVNVEQLLNSFTNLEFKIMKPVESSPNSLGNYLENEKIKSFIFNGKTINLNNAFILIDQQLYAPINEIAKLLGLSTSVDDKNLTISNKTINLKLSANSKSYYIGRNEKVFTSSPILQNSQIYASLETVLSEFGYDVIWDSESEELTIYKE